MGPLTSQQRDESLREQIETYLRALGCPDIAIENLPLESSFHRLREHIDKAAGIESPEVLDFAECRIEWNGSTSEGSCHGSSSVSVFRPDSAGELPPPGTETRLRLPATSHRVIALARTDHGVSIARAPHRQERRLHKRLNAPGYAVLRVGKEEKRVDLHDISEGGVGLTSTFLIETGQHLEFLLRLEGKRSIAFECEGLVVNCRRPMRDTQMDCWLGVQFTKVPPDMRDEIRRVAREDTP